MVWYGYGDTVASGFTGNYGVYNFSTILGPSKLDGKTHPWKTVTSERLNRKEYAPTAEDDCSHRKFEKACPHCSPWTHTFGMKNMYLSDNGCVHAWVQVYRICLHTIRCVRMYIMYALFPHILLPKACFCAKPHFAPMQWQLSDAIANSIKPLLSSVGCVGRS